MNYIAVGAGGFLGALLRYVLGMISLNENTVFPIKTFLINVVGCLFIGLITVAAGRNTAIDEKWILFLKVGFCGGFTTFSTFALETTELMKNGHLGIAFLYVFSSILVGCLVIIGVEYLLMK
ncbi:fluoride efflux transporter CrcB [Kandleria sp.]|uniref:fluoride efflux transporter CrcB n=1 Tax=Kandleria sp. TaxID=2774291 RepID=UPI001B6324A9|nr:fluoride efflux transporter CrcB [Kandleria sp.]MBP3276786.1 fluoride efflux transporter CrcB [Kandleria sp.]